jgi:uncharacterized protein
MLSFILAIFGLYLLIQIVVAWISVHPPRTPTYLSPSYLGLPQEEVVLDRNLKAWAIDHPAGQTVLIHVHGYVMNRCEFLPTAFKLYPSQISSLLVDLRGHGRSPGKKCTFGVEESRDVQAAIDEAKRRWPGKKVVLNGSSMGAASIVLCLARNPFQVDGVVLDSCYSRLSKASLGWWIFLGGKPLALALAPTILFGYLFSGVNPFRIDLAREISKIKDLKILFLHGEADPLVSLSEAQRNFAAAPNASVVAFPSCGHSDFRWNDTERYIEAISDFIAQF